MILKDNFCEQEEWRDIVGYKGLYQVSNLGNIKSLSRYIRTSDKLGGIRKKKESLLSFDVCKNGYLRVNLSNNYSTKHFFVHRLVAETFLPNTQNAPQVNHKDEDKTNNRVSNLEWCDAKYNSNYGERTKKITIAKLKKVKQYDMQGNFIREFSSFKEASDSVGVSVYKQDCKEGKSAGVYQWRMNDEPCGVYKRSHYSPKSHIKITTPNGSIMFFEGYSDAAKFLGISKGLFSRIICGSRSGKNLCGYTIEWEKINGQVKTIKL